MYGGIAIKWFSTIQDGLKVNGRNQRRHNPGADMTNTEFMYAVVADLSQEMESIDSNDPALHCAIRDTIAEVGSKELFARGVRLYFDPISKTVGEVFHTASLLQSFKLARRTNPTFSELLLSLDDEARAELMQNLGATDLKLAKRFADILRKKLPKAITS
jgi:hypothetical protein